MEKNTIKINFFQKMQKVPNRNKWEKNNQQQLTPKYVTTKFYHLRRILKIFRERDKLMWKELCRKILSAFLTAVLKAIKKCKKAFKILRHDFLPKSLSANYSSTVRAETIFQYTSSQKISASL